MKKLLLLLICCFLFACKKEAKPITPTPTPQKSFVFKVTSTQSFNVSIQIRYAGTNQYVTFDNQTNLTAPYVNSYDAKYMDNVSIIVFSTGTFTYSLTYKGMVLYSTTVNSTPIAGNLSAAGVAVPDI